VWFPGRARKAVEVAAQIPSESRTPVTLGDHRQGYFPKTSHIPAGDPPVRLVIWWDRKHGKEAVTMLVTHRGDWELTRLLRVSRRRWTGTETFPRDGQQQLGMGDCQLRMGEGQTRHRDLVLLAHNLLMAEWRQGRASAWAHRVLTTIGEACRAVLRETLGKTLSWAIERATTDGWSHDRIKAPLALA
jgi:hypothetical protein